MEKTSLTLKQKLLNNIPIMGTHVVLSEPTAAQLMSYQGYDFIWIDTEHAALDYSVLLQYMNNISLGNSASVVRVTMNDKNHVKHVLEMGPDGIIFPMINTAQEAEEAVRSCLYPPIGNRGFGPLRAIKYGFRTTEDYVTHLRDDLSIFVQLETVEAIKNLPEIVKNPYIDAYIFGLFDLSASVGELGNIFGEKTMAALREGIKVLKSSNKRFGMSTHSTDPATLRKWRDLGASILASGSDHTFIIEGGKRNYENLKDIFSV